MTGDINLPGFGVSHTDLTAGLTRAHSFGEIPMPG